MPENLLVLRSMTKLSALAGLRLGLAYGAPNVIDALRRSKPPWNVNALAQAAGTYLLTHPLTLPDLAALEANREALRAGLRGCGLSPEPTACNFFLVDVRALASRRRTDQPDAAPAAVVRRMLLEQGCLVRDCSSFGLPGFIRVSVRGAQDGERLVSAFRRIFGPAAPTIG